MNACFYPASPFLPSVPVSSPIRSLRVAANHLLRSFHPPSSRISPASTKLCSALAITMLHRCSYCGHNGHNSRTCFETKGTGFKLFGVRLSAEPAPAECSSSSATTEMRKSFSMGNLYNYGASEGGANSLTASSLEPPEVAITVEGYASDDVVHTNCSSQERKKGVPWTEEEHRSFLIGLQTLGKGDWRGISRNFVKTRTPTQVASHAQKYFLRQSNVNKRRRRSSLFDITQNAVSDIPEEPGVEDADHSAELNLGQSIPYGSSSHLNSSLLSQHSYTFGGFAVPVPQLLPTSIPIIVPNMTGWIGKARGVTDSETTGMEEVTKNGFVRQSIDVKAMEPITEVNDDTERTSDQLRFQFPLVPIWPMRCLGSDSKLVKPVPVAPKPLAKVSDAENLPEITIDTHRPVMEPTPLSHKLLEEHARHSAFHMTSPATASRDIDGQVINAISVP